MNFVFWVFAGFAVGALSVLFIATPEGRSVAVRFAVAIGGGIVGGRLFAAVPVSPTFHQDDFSPGSLAAALLGSALLLLTLKLVLKVKKGSIA